MRIFLTGVGCVGKSTIGKIMAELLGIRFFDLDNEIENFFETSIERLQNRFLTTHSFRDEAAKALVDLLNRPESMDCVLALPPSGLMGGYLRAIKKANGTTVVVTDKPENILDRIRFFDIDSRPIEKNLTHKEKKLYLERVFEGSLSKANRILRIIGFHVHDLNMVPHITQYHQKRKGKKHQLRFSKSGDRKIEEAYSKHYHLNQSPEKKQDIIERAMPEQDACS